MADPAARDGLPGTVQPTGAANPQPRGLARERTVLAWNRSGLAAVVCIAVLLRHLWPLEGDGELVAIAAIALAAIAWAVGLLTFTRSTAGRQDEGLLGEKVFRLMTIGTLLLAVGGFVLAFFAPT